ncbi:MAG: MarC family protein [Planctomycetes bacterium]|nr:MarC family protein [Planctomycetota bacterium]MCH9725179.1 MarC family protein [Planctomycetota bacterium]MCH9776589.1 MarC family protein [Planctomycetota bacterium]MCH9789675.1 MarC family protein [Planctomycetota bacterium]
MWEDILKDFIYLWAVIDPIGSIPVFMAVTAGYSRSVQRQIAFRAIMTAGIVLILFAVGGQLILELLEIPLPAFQIAGGLVLFLFALTMIFGESKPEAEIEESHKMETHQSKAVYPLAIPSIASPGAMMAIVLITDNHRFEIQQQMIATLTMLSVLAVTLILLLLAGAIQKVIGDSGASVLSRIGGLILASVAVDSVLSGIKTYFAL